MNKTEAAQKIIKELDAYAREFNVFEYGLPIYNGDSADSMTSMVVHILENMDE